MTGRDDAASCACNTGPRAGEPPSLGEQTVCNAWNHSPSCNCGWGGSGHSGGRWGNLTRAARLAIIQDARSSTGYTTIRRWRESSDDICRETTCPKCGAVVYFVRHNGGSVWFDSLGWPWPKHSCFASSYPSHIAKTAKERSLSKSKLHVGTVTECGAKLDCPSFKVECVNGDTFFIDDIRNEGESWLGKLVFIFEQDDSSPRIWPVKQ